MRGARAILLVCLTVGLAAVAFAARSHLRELQRSLEAGEARALRADLRDRAREFAPRLDETVRAAPVTAVYDLEGRLLRPAPPSEARRAVLPAVPAALDPDRQLRAALSSGGRARALLRKGYAERDADVLARALGEEALRGTELSFRVRLEIFRLRGQPPDADWVDDVSALLGGASARFARALLAGAGVEATDTTAERRELAALRPRPGYSYAGDSLQQVTREGDRLVLRRVALASLHAGRGAVAQPLPEPFTRVVVRGDLDRAALREQLAGRRLELGALYLLAAAILVVGTIYAYLAIGRAHRLAREKSDFIANVTHELKTPLANIRLFGESLRDGRVRAGDRAGFLDTILQEAGRLDLLVEGLLHVARGPRLELAAVAPQRLLREAEARWRPRLEGEGFSLSVRAPELPAVSGDEDALLRALGNLLDNARKYGGADKSIELEGAARNGEVRLTVRDRGPGIPAPDRRRVLRPFARLEGADRKETPGAGLGLSLAAATMEAHGGRLEIGSGGEAGGAAVTLVLPAEAKR